MRKIFAAAVCAIAVSAAASAPDDELRYPADAFGARESLADVSLSPDGTGIVYIAPGRGQASNVFSVDLESGEAALAATSSGDPLSVRWCEFAGRDRVVCRLYGIMQDGTALYSINRLISFDTDGGNGVSLGQRQSFYDYYGRYYDGTVIDWLPEDDGGVLMSRVYVPEANRVNTRLVSRDEGLGVDHVDTRTARARRVEPPQTEVGQYMTDRHGNVRLIGSLRSRGATGMADDTISYHYRTPGDREWRDLDSYNFIARAGFLPLEIDADLNAVYGLQRHNGRDALFRIALDGSMTRELVFAHDEVDVDNVVRIGRAGRIIGVTFAEDQRFTRYFDAEYAALAQALGQAIPNLPLIRFAGASDDENRLLVWAGGDDDPGRYFIFDKAAQTLNEIMVARPELEGVRLATVRPVRYRAADGTMIPGYLTLPPGREEARGLPAIVMPHGGPGARDEWGFDWLAQYFAHQGYAVLQPNFRGSAGYGDDWFVVNGFQNWEIAIGDVNAGGRWLVSEGVADPEHLAILGWSYGGYAALQSAVLDPGLFRAVVAIAPVTDLDLLRDLERNYASGANVREFLGQGPHIRAGSPAQNAERIAVPVLLVHGTRDAAADFRHSELMRDRLEAAGRDVEMLVFEGLDHGLTDSAARARMLERSDLFLRDALGMPAPSAPLRNPQVAAADEPDSGPREPVFPGAVVPEGAVGPDGRPPQR